MFGDSSNYTDKDCPASWSMGCQDSNHPNMSPDYYTEGDAFPSHSRWKLRSNPTTSLEARKYEISSKESLNDGLAYQILKNLSNTKKSITELIEKSRRTEWKKRTPATLAKQNYSTYPLLEKGCNSGINLTKTPDNEYDFTMRSSNTDPLYTFRNSESAIDLISNDQTIDSLVNIDTIVNDDYKNIKENRNHYYENYRGTNLENRISRSSDLDKEVGKDRTVQKVIFRGVSSEELTDADKLSKENIKIDGSEEIIGRMNFNTRFRKSSDRSVNLKQEVQSSSGVRGITKSSALIARLKGVEKSSSVIEDPEMLINNRNIDGRNIQMDIPNNRSVSGMMVSKFSRHTGERSLGISKSGETFNMIDINNEQKRLETAVLDLPHLTLAESSHGELQRPIRERTSETQIRPRNSISNLSGGKRLSQERVVHMANDGRINNQHFEYQWEGGNENNTHENQISFSDISQTAEGNLPSPKISDELLKWNFPNSNRKREEKLRALEKTLKINEQNSFNSIKKLSDFNNSMNCLDNSKNNAMSYSSEMKSSILDYSVDLNNDLSEHAINTSASSCLNFRILKNVEDSHNKDNNFEDMNTLTALIYWSETLIESAQRAEILLMQKMKEYNDLVCRDPPEKSVREASCQADEPEIEVDFENTLKDVKEKFKREMNEKINKVKQLENDKKKLKQAMKKLISSIEKKCLLPDNEEVGLEVEINNVSSRSPNKISPRSSSETIEQKALEKEELVQALKLENNLLHTLLKEMKTELEQENATIFSLAKKLEMSMIQTQSKQQSQTSNCTKELECDVVRKLEEKLEQQEKLLKQEAMEARAVAKFVITKYKNLIKEYKEKVKSHQETVDKLTKALK